MPSYMDTRPCDDPTLEKVVAAAQQAGLTVEHIRFQGKRSVYTRRLFINGYMCHVQHMSRLFGRRDRNALYVQGVLSRETVEEYPFHLFAVELKYGIWTFIVPRGDLLIHFDTPEQKSIAVYIRIDNGKERKRKRTFDFGGYIDAWNNLKNPPIEQ